MQFDFELSDLKLQTDSNHEPQTHNASKVTLIRPHEAKKSSVKPNNFSSDIFKEEFKEERKDRFGGFLESLPLISQLQSYNFPSLLKLSEQQQTPSQTQIDASIDVIERHFKTKDILPYIQQLYKTLLIEGISEQQQKFIQQQQLSKHQLYNKLPTYQHLRSKAVHDKITSNQKFIYNFQKLNSCNMDGISIQLPQNKIIPKQERHNFQKINPEVKYKAALYLSQESQYAMSKIKSELVNQKNKIRNPWNSDRIKSLMQAIVVDTIRQTQKLMIQKYKIYIYPLFRHEILTIYAKLYKCKQTLSPQKSQVFMKLLKFTYGLGESTLPFEKLISFYKFLLKEIRNRIYPPGNFQFNCQDKSTIQTKYYKLEEQIQNKLKTQRLMKIQAKLQAQEQDEGKVHQKRIPIDLNVFVKQEHVQAQNGSRNCNKVNHVPEKLVYQDRDNDQIYEESQEQKVQHQKNRQQHQDSHETTAQQPQPHTKHPPSVYHHIRPNTNTQANNPKINIQPVHDILPHHFSMQRKPHPYNIYNPQQKFLMQYFMTKYPNYRHVFDGKALLVKFEVIMKVIIKKMKESSASQRITTNGLFPQLIKLNQDRLNLLIRSVQGLKIRLQIISFVTNKLNKHVTLATIIKDINHFILSYEKQKLEQEQYLYSRTYQPAEVHQERYSLNEHVQSDIYAEQVDQTCQNDQGMMVQQMMGQQKQDRYTSNGKQIKSFKDLLDYHVNKIHESKGIKTNKNNNIYQNKSWQ